MSRGIWPQTKSRHLPRDIILVNIICGSYATKYLRYTRVLGHGHNHTLLRLRVHVVLHTEEGGRAMDQHTIVRGSWRKTILTTATIKEKVKLIRFKYKRNALQPFFMDLSNNAYYKFKFLNTIF